MQIKKKLKDHFSDGIDVFTYNNKTIMQIKKKLKDHFSYGIEVLKVSKGKNSGVWLAMGLFVIALCINVIHISQARHEDMNNPALRYSKNLSSKYTILPKKIYSVIGFELSGEEFVAETIQKALKIKGDCRNGTSPHGNIDAEEEDIQVHRVSLPWGPKVEGNPTPVLDVVLPSQCSRDNSTDDMKKQCAEMTNELWGFSAKGKVEYPQRYNLDIVAHKEWYEKHGVEQYVIIVLGKHEALPVEEEELAKDTIIDAINKFVLEKPDTERKVTRDNYDFWHASKVESLNPLREVSMSNLLPNGNNVVLVSYESLMTLKEPYLKMLYNAVDIQSDYMPTFN